MNLEAIKNILLSKSQANKLAHFYLVSPSHGDTENTCFNWTKELVKALSESSKSIENMTDVLMIDSSHTTDKQYKIDDIDLINDFLNYRAIELKRKFLIINEAHKLTQIHANKLLKTLEEPPIPLTIFLINNRRSKLLTTIESRAIKLRLPTQKPAQTNYLTKVISNNMSYQDFTQDAQSQEIAIDSMVQEVLSLANEKELSFNAANKIKDYIDQIQTDLLFHTPKPSVLFKLFQCVNLLK